MLLPLIAISLKKLVLHMVISSFFPKNWMIFSCAVWFLKFKNSGFTAATLYITCKKAISSLLVHMSPLAALASIIINQFVKSIKCHTVFYFSNTVLGQFSLCDGNQVHKDYSIGIYFATLFGYFVQKTLSAMYIVFIIFILETFLYCFWNKYYLCRIKHVTTKIGCSDCAPWSLWYSGKLFW